MFPRVAILLSIAPWRRRCGLILIMTFAPIATVKSGWRGALFYVCALASVASRLDAVSTMHRYTAAYYRQFEKYESELSLKRSCVETALAASTDPAPMFSPFANSKGYAGCVPGPAAVQRLYILHARTLEAHFAQQMQFREALSLAWWVERLFCTSHSH